MRASPADWWEKAALLADRAAEVAAQIAVILLLSWLAVRLARRAVTGLAKRLERRGEREGIDRGAARVETVRTLLESIVRYGAIFVAAVMILNALGLDTRTLLASAGIVGLAVGFGAQRLVRDVITGIFLLAENQFVVGDTITAAGHTGVVEEIGLRVTRLRDETGKEVFLANGDISSVVNHSRGPLLVSIDFAVGAGTDLEKLALLVAAIPEASPHLKRLLAEPPAVRGIVSFDAARITARLTARAHPGRQQEAELALREALRRQLASGGVTMV